MAPGSIGFFLRFFPGDGRSCVCMLLMVVHGDEVDFFPALLIFLFAFAGATLHFLHQGFRVLEALLELTMAQASMKTDLSVPQ